MTKNLKIIIFTILTVGVLFRLAMTSNGSFIFNMDNARDMVEVREIVVLHKLRLTGPTSAIDGFYTGPAWYYLLSIPFILSGGDPYASILMEILLWAVGGFFLMKLVSRWGKWLLVPIGLVWVSSNYIVLTNLYAFNPNPVTLLTPLLIHLLVEYLQTKKTIFGILTWTLSGLFFNFEMNFGIFMPIIIFSSLIFTKNLKLLKQKGFWVGVGIFVLALLPQVAFDLKHQFIMSKAILRHLSENPNPGLKIGLRFQEISASFYNTFLPTLMNHQSLSKVILLLSIPILFGFWKMKKKDSVVIVGLIFILVPFLGYLFLPVSVNPWHLGAEMAAALILIGYLLKKLIDVGVAAKIASAVLTILISFFAISNITNFVANDWGKPSDDPSLYRNEIAAIDYVYRYAAGRNFKVYTYLPSVYDYPYQYLIWWHGIKEFGYLPIDYAYAPNKPQIISNKQSFSATEKSLKERKNSNLVFLIKEPDRNWTRPGWEGDFVKLESISKLMIGPIEVEVRKEIIQQ